MRRQSFGLPSIPTSTTSNEKVLLAPPFAFLDMMLLGDRACLLPAIDSPSAEVADIKSNNEADKRVIGSGHRARAPSIEAITGSTLFFLFVSSQASSEIERKAKRLGRLSVRPNRHTAHLLANLQT